MTLPLVAGRATDRLARAATAKETLLVRVENRHECHLGQIETLTEQIHADQHVVLAQTKLADDLDPFEGVDLGMEGHRAFTFASSR